MVTTTFDVKDLPRRFVEAISSPNAYFELIIVDNQIPVARIIVCTSNPARLPGLHAGTIATTEDFDAPLPDEFWTGAP